MESKPSKETAPWMREAAEEIVTALDKRLVISGMWTSMEHYVACRIASHCPVAVECTAPAPQLTRFNEFDDDDHPFRQWWLKHGHLMLSGGGRRESIWAARGWIAREQLACGAEVTGDSMHERGTSEQAPQVTPESAPDLELEQEADGRWLAEFTRFPGVAAYGPSKEEAIRNAAKVLIQPDTPKCRRCAEGNIPEWSKDAKCYIHRSPRLDRRCDNPPNPPCIQVPEETVSSPEHQSWLVERKKQDPLNPRPIVDVESEQASPTPDKCPRCGSHSKNGYHAHHEDRTKRCYVKGMGRSDPWHSD